MSLPENENLTRHSGFILGNNDTNADDDSFIVGTELIQ